MPYNSSDITLTKQQTQAYDEIIDFLFNSSDMLYVFSGVAGAGKTMIISKVLDFVSRTNINIQLMTPTGRASSILNFYSTSIYKSHTIHSVIYEPVFNDKEEVIGYTLRSKNALADIDCFIIDEASMVSEELLYDLSTFDIPMLLIGDAEQLPSIGSEMNLMKNYNLHLTEIHRVAEGNPVIALSREVRENGELTERMLRKYSDNNHLKILSKKDLCRSHFMEHSYDVITCGTNRKRATINNLIRSILPEWQETPLKGEQVICLKNLYRKGSPPIYNGELYVVEDMFASSYTLKSLDDNNKIIDVTIRDCEWDESCIDENNSTGKFTFGYAMTVWKCQGSQFENVLFYKENVSHFCKQKNFDYTAITRTSKNLTVMI